MNTNVQTVGDRIRQIREKCGITQTELAEAIGTTKQNLYKYENNIITNIPSDKIEKIATVCRVSPAFLMGWAEKSEIELVSRPQIKQVHVIGRVAAGLRCFADMQAEEYAPCDASLLHTGYDYVYLRVVGDSMEPELHEGDKVLVQVRDTVESGSYAVVIVDGDDGLVKKVEYTKTQLTLISENPYYPPRRFKCDEMNRVRVFGKVVGLSRCF
jgi:repressor LexA